MPMPLRPATPAGEDSGTPKDLAGLCRVADSLATLLEEETRLVRAMRIREIGPLQPDKARLTRLCGTAVKSIDPAAPVPPDVRQRWQAASKRLGDAALANEMALRVGRAATDRLVSAIISQIEKERGSSRSYTRPTPAAPGARRRPAPLSGVAVDRRL